MKKRIVILVIIILLIVLAVSILERAVLADTSYLNFPTMIASKEWGVYIITISKSGEKSKYVHFSESREILKIKGIVPVEIESTQELLGMEMTDIITQYGDPHTDIGSGFCIPAYITKNAYLVAIHLDDNGIVSYVFKEDLIKGSAGDGSVCSGDDT